MKVCQLAIQGACFSPLDDLVRNKSLLAVSRVRKLSNHRFRSSYSAFWGVDSKITPRNVLSVYFSCSPLLCGSWSVIFGENNKWSIK